MATNGIVSIMYGDRVKMKVVCGSNGDKAVDFAVAFAKQGTVLSPTEADNLANSVKFGTPETRVVMTEDEMVFVGDEEEDPHPRYRETFDQPEFNPRFPDGVAAHIVLVQLHGPGDPREPVVEIK